MKIYHGSIYKIEIPQLSKGRKFTDFGKGFYTTTNLRQAKDWAKAKRGREKGIKAIVSVYETDDGILEKYKSKIFKGVTEEWLEFVLQNRNGVENEFFDLIMGPVADDKVYFVLNSYIEGIFTFEETINALKIRELFDQLSFHSEQALSELRFIESYELIE